MDAKAAQQLLSQFQKTLEDIWLEKQCCRNFILDRGLIAESDLDDMLEKAKRDPENRRIAAQTFAGSRKALAEFGSEDLLRRLASNPESKDKQN